MICRGGDERYDQNGKFICKRGPWWEFFFGSSYIARLAAFKIRRVNWLLLNNDAGKIEERKTLFTISKKIDEYRQLADNNHFAFVLLIQPLPYEIANDSTLLDPMYISKDITTVRVTHDMRKATSKEGIAAYSWTKDMHFNSKGYNLLCNTVMDNYFLKPGNMP